jgi:predicted nucleic acid-binding protein
MFTINSFFIDSSILIEYNKGNKKRLFIELIGNDIFKCFVNEVVLSEFLYHFLAHSGAKSPLAIKESGKISEAFETSQQYGLIRMCHFLQNDNRLFFLYRN